MARCNGSQLDEIRRLCTGAPGGRTGGWINEAMHHEGELCSDLLLEARLRWRYVRWARHGRVLGSSYVVNTYRQTARLKNRSVGRLKSYTSVASLERALMSEMSRPQENGYVSRRELGASYAQMHLYPQPSHADARLHR